MITSKDQKWIDTLILELRLRDVSGAGIGDTIASVKEFLADSGEEAQVAFGTPAEYAKSLDLSSIAEPVSLRGTILRSGIGVLAFLAFAQAIVPWLEGEKLGLGALQLILLAVPALAVLCLPLLLEKLLRNFWLLALLFGVCITSGIFAAITAPRDHGNAWLLIDPAVVLIVSSVLMVAVSIAGTSDAMNIKNDTIREPFETSATIRKNERTSRIIGVLVAWMFPISAVLFLGLDLLIR
ncbi:hypothetical protein [Paeniglutamicibacter sp. Y32M11]|uniref:hypothetical protein n=1 Tax=Paeniglutamicibacter sp. Y32M11 TaxID=2853258 RepID=UPI001C528ACD|nr:hypothetical protein [Paeniglutamicibacter sp. Y32M11]QXQ10496.1 hypothetical protein KUF55_00595 [Paeniglutamicibacter sp. Y32M11]